MRSNLRHAGSEIKEITGVGIVKKLLNPRGIQCQLPTAFEKVLYQQKKLNLVSHFNFLNDRYAR